MIEKSIWVEKYRPKNIDDVIFSDPSMKEKIANIVKTKNTGHLLFTGRSGVGKTTLAKIIANEIVDNSGDILYINASDENSVDTVRTKIKDFCVCVGMSDIKVVILDEMDHISLAGMAALRNVMEEYHKYTRFILTANYSNKIIDPIKSRCQLYTFSAADPKSIGMHVAKILKKERVKFKTKQLLPFLKACNGDMRLTINALQKHVVDGVLTDYSSLDTNREKFIGYIKDKKFNTFRQEFLNDNVDPVEFYKFMFDNAKEIHKKCWTEIMLIISEYQYRHSLAPDAHINLFGCVLEIMKTCPKEG